MCSCKYAVKKLLFVIRYVTNQYNTQKMCDKVILENGGAINFVADCYENEKMCNKAINNYAHTLEFVPDYHKFQEMYDKDFDDCPFVFGSVVD